MLGTNIILWHNGAESMVRFSVVLAEHTTYIHAVGDLVYARIFRTPVLVLNSVKVARELLDRKSSATSGRPRMMFLTEM